jgi:mRNA (guanine-N7-)-methyltransferase
MPAFDPVRDAVLNSPTLPSVNVGLNSHHPKRATDLSVLLNSDSTQSATQTPPSARPSTLFHLLLPSDPVDDKLSDSEPLRAPLLPVAKHEHSIHSATEFVNQTQLLQDSPTVPRPSKSPPSPSPPSPPILPSVPEMPSPTAATPSPPKSKIPYAPVRRLTQPASVLIPLTDAEIENHRTFRGLGTQRLSKRKREQDQLGPPNKKLASDVGVVAIHCECPNRFGACLPLVYRLMARQYPSGSRCRETPGVAYHWSQELQQLDQVCVDQAPS